MSYLGDFKSHSSTDIAEKEQTESQRKFDRSCGKTGREKMQLTLSLSINCLERNTCDNCNNFYD